MAELAPLPTPGTPAPEPKSPEPVIPDHVTLTVKSATKLLYQGDVWAVTFSNKLGPFDILPGHQNLVALVVKKLVIHFDLKKSQEIAFERGVAKVEDNQVTVYVGI
jgi:F0F1-type ATP synthase epsilon subunit